MSYLAVDDFEELISTFNELEALVADAELCCGAFNLSGLI